VIDRTSGKTSPFGVFAICVNKRSTSHEEGCSCPACNNRYEDMIGKTVRQTIAEAASKWLNSKIEEEVRKEQVGVKVVKPAAGYSSCPDHTLKKDILGILGECNEIHNHSHDHNCTCGCHGHTHNHGLGIKLT
jgi:5-methyltetrahydrofolate--homocysteine methyltransferase